MCVCGGGGGGGGGGVCECEHDITCVSNCISYNNICIVKYCHLYTHFLTNDWF